ncbi:MAG: hypothetical protein IJ744_10275 [Lachnospiraceae bacterium]|nr:hypothetical protein [Lachnospiraceae bacterium]
MIDGFDAVCGRVKARQCKLLREMLLKGWHFCLLFLLEDEKMQTSFEVLSQKLEA